MCTSCQLTAAKFLTAHIHLFLPTVAFHSGCLPTAGQGKANNPLAVIAEYVDVKVSQPQFCFSVSMFHCF